MRISLYIVIVLLILSCSMFDSKYHVLESLVFEQTKVTSFDSINWLAIVSEKGCPGCNIAFSNLMTKHLSDKNGIVLVYANGSIIDIRPFILESSTNVFELSFYNQFKELNILDKSGVIFFKKNEIDSVVQIKAEKLDNQLNYITSRIQGLK